MRDVLTCQQTSWTKWLPFYTGVLDTTCNDFKNVDVYFDVFNIVYRLLKELGPIFQNWVFSFITKVTTKKVSISNFR